MNQDTEFTFRNSATDLLNKKGKEVIKAILKQLKCKQCGSDLGIMTYMEGDYVICKSKGDRCETGYDIDIRSNPPSMLENNGSKVTEVCNICKGTGVILTGAVCEWCEGKGSIERDSFSPLSVEGV